MSNFKKTFLELIVKMPSLFFGFFLYAVGILLALYSRLGMSPWDVFHVGVVNHSVLTLGQVSQVVGFVIILLSVFLGVVPGIGSILNMIFKVTREVTRGRGFWHASQSHRPLDSAPSFLAAKGFLSDSQQLLGCWVLYSRFWLDCIGFFLLFFRKNSFFSPWRLLVITYTYFIATHTLPRAGTVPPSGNPRWNCTREQLT